MLLKKKQITNQFTLAINCTDNSFGFALRKHNEEISDDLFIKTFDKDLCNNLIVDFNKFISKGNLRYINKISVSIGPSNFNASRLTVVLARTISQQIKCPLISFSSFELMAKRIALTNNIYSNKQSFWIYKKLNRKGFIAGKYKVCYSEKQKDNFIIIEKVVPKLVQELDNKEPFFKANFNAKEDLIELLNLSNKNLGIVNSKSWEKVLPHYPISPIN